MSNIHPSAIISSEAKIASDAVVGAFSVIEAGAEIGKGCRIESHVVLKRGTILEESVNIHSFCVIAGDPQDLNFDVNLKSGVRVGAHTTLREGVTLSRATVEGHYTTVGHHCFFMAYSHAGHDCAIGNHVVMANAVLLAGKVTVGDFAFLGGSAVFHQGIRIGESVMASGNSSIAYDLPPFTTCAERNMLHGLNLVGMKRRGFSLAEVTDVKRCYRAVYAEVGNYVVKAQEALNSGVATTERGKQFLEFFSNCKRGVVSSQGFV
jgi:UDP-N-acetylglucosamine acyltransferase